MRGVLRKHAFGVRVLFFGFFLFVMMCMCSVFHAQTPSVFVIDEFPCRLGGMTRGGSTPYAAVEERLFPKLFWWCWDGCCVAVWRWCPYYDGVGSPPGSNRPRCGNELPAALTWARCQRSAGASPRCYFHSGGSVFPPPRNGVGCEKRRLLCFHRHWYIGELPSRAIVAVLSRTQEAQSPDFHGKAWCFCCFVVADIPLVVVVLSL